MENAPAPPPPPQFLDPHALIEQSAPAPRAAWLWYLSGGFVCVVLASTFASQQSQEMQAAVRVLGAVTMVGLMGLMSVVTWVTVNRQREEQRKLEAAEELIQLRRWGEAGMTLQATLGQPMRSAVSRVQALLYLATVLARYHRYADAMVVQNYLIDEATLDPNTQYAMKLGKAMAMLQQDFLSDAHGAISELRRLQGSEASAGLALLELYRDVKTGHPAEAIEIFEAKKTLLRDQLGHRVADAWALVARAYDMVGMEAQAAGAYANATVLAPVAELSRKYAEVAALTGKYSPAAAPNE